MNQFYWSSIVTSLNQIIVGLWPNESLNIFSMNTSGQLDILWHDGDMLDMDGTQVSIFKKTNQESFRSFLESKDGRWLESKVSFEIVCDFSNESLERKFSDEELSRFLESSETHKNAI